MRREGTTLTVLCSNPAALGEVPAPAEGPVCAAVADRVRVADVMTSDVVCVPEELTIAGLLLVLLSRDVDEVIVVDRDHRPVGLVRRADLLGRRDGRVADVMVPARFALEESATLTEATMLMAYQALAQVPVVSSEGELTGVLAQKQVCRLVTGRPAGDRPDR